MSNERITIKSVHDDAILASAIVEKGVQFFEGAWYFDVKFVDMSDLLVTKREYICPYKGTCYWIDLKVAGKTAVENVAFTYFDIKPGYEFIQHRIAFYAGRREGTYEESEEIVVD